MRLVCIDRFYIFFVAYNVICVGSLLTPFTPHQNSGYLGIIHGRRNCHQAVAYQEFRDLDGAFSFSGWGFREEGS